MSRINAIQKAILELDGGSFQKLIDGYLYKKYKFDNIHPLGSQTATNKVTKGTPDSFVENKDGKYTLIMYGAVETIPFQKIKQDILSCFEKDKLVLEKEKIEKIISVYTSTNIHVEQLEELKKLVPGVEIELIGLGTISHDLLIHYPVLAKDYLDISIDTEQILSISDFVNRYDKNGMNAPLAIEFKHRETELDDLYNSIRSSDVTMLSGNSGVGKTRLAVEVCKKFENEGFKIWCIKNNGQALFDDIRFYLSEPSKYILLIDDANQTSNLNYILDYITTTSEDNSIKVLMTVRDYAKKHVEMIAQKYFRLKEITINPFSNDEIQAILKSNLEIQNSEYLDRITMIANGNARLAILAGYYAIQNGFHGLKNATDVFKSYYGEIINSQNLQMQEINVLFIVSLLGTVKVDDSNELASEILQYFNIDTLSFLNICHKLNEMELLDLYQDQIARISDQSFGNYLLEHVLLEKKYISVRKLLSYGFPKFKTKIIYALNTLVNLFPDSENAKYIEEQINDSWEQADPDIQNVYLQCFHNLNQEKALQLIKSKIDNMDVISKDLKQFHFENAKRNKSIENEYIDMLGDFKNSKYLEEVVALLFTAFLKRPDMVMDFYFVFTEKLSFNYDSYKDDYETEFLVINSLWSLSEEGKIDENFNVLLVQILKSMLNCTVQRVVPGDNFGTIKMVTFSVIDTKGTRVLRDLIWKILSSLYQYDFLRTEIHAILGTNHGNGMDKEKYLSIFEFDLNCIEHYFIDNWQTPYFDQFLTMKKIVNIANQLDAKYPEVYLQYEQNSEFMIYNTISKDFLGKDWETKKEENLAAVIDMVKNYSVQDFFVLFELCKKIENKDVAGRENWTIGSNIVHIFNTFKDRSDYIELVQQYLLNNAPYASSVHHSVLNRLVELLGIKEAIQLINEYEFADKNSWLGNIWSYLHAAKVDSDIKEKMLVFFTSQKKGEDIVVPNILRLKHYFSDDRYLVQKISEWVIDIGKDDPKLITGFFEPIYDEESAIEVLKVFEENIELLEHLYLLNSYDTHFDYQGSLLEVLIYRNIDFWDKYTKKLSELISIESNTEIFEKVWLFDNYKEYVTIAYNNLLFENFGYIRESVSSSLFLNDKNIDSVITRRKENWIKEYICDNYKDIQSMEILFGVIQNSFTIKTNYYLDFLKYSKNVEEFKALPLSPLSYTWGGSEVPLIDRRINFVEDLITQIKGLDFIEHRSYLKEYKKELEKYRKRVQIKEYEEEYDRM